MSESLITCDSVAVDFMLADANCLPLAILHEGKTRLR